MRNARPTRRQIEANSDDLGFDALAITPARVEALTVSDEVIAAEDLLANAGYMAFELPEFVYDSGPLAEFAPELEQIEAELLAHEARAAELAAVLRLRVGESHAVRGWAA